MCGIAGFIDSSGRTSRDALRVTAHKMADSLRHRGPDDAGVWVDAPAGIALAHRRLAVLDVSAAGHQPMCSASGRYILVFNGEIYNFQELRGELEQRWDAPSSFRGNSDTEVMLACFDRWGVETSIPRFNGMFAFAVWDRQQRVLHLCRDRFGEKPLYYGWVANLLLFGSELKALRAHPEFRGEINRDALALYLRHNCIPAPHSIYQGISKLPPGTYLRVHGGPGLDAPPTPYWSLKETVESGLADPFRGSEEEALEQASALLRDAVKIRMLADVPLGAFLSGGVDSSAVVALMQVQSARPVRTFSIGLRETGYNEAPQASRVAQHLGTDHTEHYVTPAEVMDVIPRLPAMYDEPFADSSEIPTFLVSQLARQHVTVSLSGDGGDEVFGGYNRHLWSERIWNAVRWVPRGVRGLVSAAMTRVPAPQWETFFRLLEPLLPEALKQRTPGDKLHKLAGILALPDQAAMYLGLASHWRDAASVVLEAREPASLLTTARAWAKVPDFTQQMMFLDAATYLPDDILVKLDRASMAVSLEARVPYLDHRVVEFAWRLPLPVKLRDGTGKWILRQILHRHVPEELVKRAKTGFAIPLDVWLRGPLRDWAAALLEEHRLERESFFDPQAHSQAVGLHTCPVKAPGNTICGTS